MKTTLLTTLSVSMLTMTGLSADEQYNHFPSLEAPDTTVALCNLNKFNARLAGIVEQSEIGVEDMLKIHELTYTLENAVQRLQQDLEGIAAELEKTHKGSEAMQQDTVKSSANAYLKALSPILAPKHCG
ncbi:DUF6746 family protein [Planctobacterium marinum]|uniref:DUF6746 family protein n=1 Tax=Planctobacterium marinum TaxID=1631968 RepID=UPI001E4C7C3C|nr:DUF6746 family protein [Planctobacterium marinum]MCC2608213.1 hypothetical protein [Planctobacterium marinum]